MRVVTALTLSLIAAPLSQASAQAAGVKRLSSVISTNPLGFLQLGPNVEYEFATGDANGLGLGVRLPSLGLYSHVINDGIKSGWTVYGVWHVYPKQTRLRAWYVGPHIEFGRTDNDSYRSNIFGGGGEFGRRWVRANGFSIVLGGLLGAFKSNDEWKDGTGSAGSETYLAWMLNFSLGVAR